MYQTGTHGSVGGRLANQSSASYPIVGLFSQNFSQKLILDRPSQTPTASASAKALPQVRLFIGLHELLTV